MFVAGYIDITLVAIFVRITCDTASVGIFCVCCYSVRVHIIVIGITFDRHTVRCDVVDLEIPEASSSTVRHSDISHINDVTLLSRVIIVDKV